MKAALALHIIVRKPDDSLSPQLDSRRFVDLATGLSPRDPEFIRQGHDRILRLEPEITG